MMMITTTSLLLLLSLNYYYSEFNAIIIIIIIVISAGTLMSTATACVKASSYCLPKGDLFLDACRLPELMPLTA